MHAYLRGMWLRPTHVTPYIKRERTTITARSANKRSQTLLEMRFLQLLLVFQNNPEKYLGYSNYLQMI